MFDDTGARYILNLPAVTSRLLTPNLLSSKARLPKSLDWQTNPHRPDLKMNYDLSSFGCILLERR
jgi:hypothetical protein